MCVGAVEGGSGGGKRFSSTREGRKEGESKVSFTSLVLTARVS